MSSPCHQPEKWNGMKQVSGPTRSVTIAFTLIFTLPPPAFLPGVLTQTYSPLRMPRSAAAFGWISTKLSCCSSASHGLERVSSPPPSYSTSRPLVRISGKFFATLSFTACCCTDLKRVGSRQNTFTSSWVGYFSTRSGRGLKSASRCCGMASGKFHTTARALALPKGMQPCFIATRWMPPEVSFAQVLPSASFFSASLSSSHHPSFFSSTWSNCGYPEVISPPFGYEPSSASRFTPSRSMPNSALKQPPPSITCLEVSYRLGEPGCLISALP